MPKQESKDADSVPFEEMLRRLKDGDEDSGELVTRSDGTRMVKRRSKKRRSKQPQREATKKARKQLITRLIGASVIAFLLVAGFGFLLVKYNSKAFEDRTLQEITNATGTDVTLKSFSVSPVSISVKELALKGRGSHYIESLVLKEVSTSMAATGFLLNKISGDSVTAKGGDLIVKRPVAGLSSSLTEDPLSRAAAQERLRYGHYACNRLNAQFGAHSGLSPFSIRETNAVLYIKDGSSDVRVRGGRVEVEGFGEFTIENGTIALRSDEVEFVGLRLRPPSGGGSMELTNTLSLAPSESSNLNAVFRNVSFSDILPHGLGKLFNGTFSSEVGVLQLGSLEQPELNMVVPFKQGDLFLDRMPFLAKLTDALELASSRPEFRNKVEGVIRRSASSTAIESLYLQDLGRLILTGRIEANGNGSLAGRLELGVSERVLTTADGQPRVGGFSKVRDGYHWITIKISGSTASPKDNFESQLTKVEHSPSIESSGGFENMFEQLLE